VWGSVPCKVQVTNTFGGGHRRKRKQEDIQSPGPGEGGQKKGGETGRRENRSPGRLETKMAVMGKGNHKRKAEWDPGF